MRIFTASFATETNTFSPIPTDRRSFEDRLWFEPGNHPDDATLCSAPMAVLRRRAAAEGFELVEGLATFADPSGSVSSEAYTSIRDEIMGQLAAALPVDAVVLGLHGAMVAHGCDDCEGDLLARARALAGADCVIAAEMDPHCHLSPLRMEMADLLVCFKEYSHIDFVERAEELVELTLRTVRGEIRPVMRAWDCRMIDRYPTFRPEMRAFTDKLMSMEAHSNLSTFSELDPEQLASTASQRDPAMLSISCVHGFMRADGEPDTPARSARMPRAANLKDIHVAVEDVGAAILVITDGDADKAARVAEELGREFFELRGRTLPPYLSADEAIEQAVAEREARGPAGTGSPTLIIDTGDNPGGGNPGDRTVVLRRLLAHGVTDAAFGPLFDPQAVQFCHAVGRTLLLPGLRAFLSTRAMVVRTGRAGRADSAPFRGQDGGLGRRAHRRACVGRCALGQPGAGVRRSRGQRVRQLGAGRADPAAVRRRTGGGGDSLQHARADLLADGVEQPWSRSREICGHSDKIGQVWPNDALLLIL